MAKQRAGIYKGEKKKRGKKKWRETATLALARGLHAKCTGAPCDANHLPSVKDLCVEQKIMATVSAGLNPNIENCDVVKVRRRRNIWRSRTGKDRNIINHFNFSTSH